MTAAERIPDLLKGLKKTFPEANCTLDHRNPLDLLVATILSAQCTDVRVNALTPELFRKYRSAADYVRVPAAELEQDIRPTGFFRNKARSIQACCQALVERHDSQVPGRMEDLVRLRGIGRKTANVVLAATFGQPAIIVDTHVKRLSRRLGLTRQNDPDRIEQDLMKIVPRAEWTRFSHSLILHGRKVCKAQRPACADCAFESFCPFPRTVEGKKAREPA